MVPAWPGRASCCPPVAIASAVECGCQVSQASMARRGVVARSPAKRSACDAEPSGSTARFGTAAAPALMTLVLPACAGHSSPGPALRTPSAPAAGADAAQLRIMRVRVGNAVPTEGGPFRPASSSRSGPNARPSCRRDPAGPGPPRRPPPDIISSHVEGLAAARIPPGSARPGPAESGMPKGYGRRGLVTITARLRAAVRAEPRRPLPPGSRHAGIAAVCRAPDGVRRSGWRAGGTGLRNWP